MKVAWMTWLPQNSGAAQQLRDRLLKDNGSLALVFVEPKRQFEPEKCLELVAEMNRDFDAVAFSVNSEMAEAIRNYRIKNFRHKGIKFAQWYSLAIKEGGKELRWCAVG
jgi:hypothetical protein